MLNICLIGAGGVGSIAAYVLEKSQRARVTAVLRSNYTLVKEHGFDIDSIDHGQITGWRPYSVVPSISAAITPNQPYNFIVITTKALPSLTASLIPALHPLITPQITSIVLIQNGLGIEAPFATAFPNTPVMSSSSTVGSRCITPRTILHEDPDVSKIAPYFHHIDGDGSASQLTREQQLNAAQEFVDLYNTALKSTTTDAQCILVPDMSARWRKLLWNATFNTFCTLLRVSVGDLLSTPTGRKALLEPAMREMAAIATAAGYGHAVSEEVVNQLLDETPLDSPFRPSMLVDLEKGRELELEGILGAPLRVAREKGVEVPVLGVLYEALKVVQWELVKKHQ